MNVEQVCSPAVVLPVPPIDFSKAWEKSGKRQNLSRPARPLNS
jgi:hypothetical protein